MTLKDYTPCKQLELVFDAYKKGIITFGELVAKSGHILSEQERDSFLFGENWEQDPELIELKNSFDSIFKQFFQG